MSRILLGATGSVAAVRVPALCRQLVEQGHDVRVVATEPALYFFRPDELQPASAEDPPRRVPVIRDADEWPGDRYSRGDDVLHIELRKWAQMLVVAPLDANTLSKFALGLCDNLLTCLYRAWDFANPVILAPAMNTLMWRKPATSRHLAQLWLDQSGVERLPADWSLDTAPAYFSEPPSLTVLIPPQSKRLACGDVGVGAMAEVVSVAEAVQAWTERTSSEAPI